MSYPAAGFLPALLTSRNPSPRRRAFTRPLALFLTCLGLGGCVFHTGGRLSKEARETEHLAATLPAKRIVLHNQVGDVVIVADAGATEVRAEATMIGRGTSIARAEEALSEIMVSFDRSPRDGQVIEAIADCPRGSNSKNYAVDWKIIAPPGVEIEVSCDVGDVSVEGFQNGAVLSVGVGDIDAMQIEGGLKVKGGVGDLTAIAGAPIDVRGDVGDADVELMRGAAESVTIRTGVGDLSLSLPRGWSGDVSAKAGTGDVSVNMPGVSKGRGSDSRFEGHIGPSGSAGSSATLSSNVGDVKVRSGG